MHNRNRKYGINIDKLPRELNAEQLLRTQWVLLLAVRYLDVDTVAKIVAKYGDNADVMNVMEIVCNVKFPLLNNIIDYSIRFNISSERSRICRLLLQAPALNVNLTGAADMNNPSGFAPIHKIFMFSDANPDTQFHFLTALLQCTDVDVNIETSFVDYYGAWGERRDIVPVFEAAKSADPRLFEALIFHSGFDPNKEYSQGRFLLLQIIQSENDLLKYDLLAELLAVEGLNPNVVTPDGKSALYLAVERSDLAFIKQLKAVDANLRAKNGYTALHAAIDTGSPEIVAALLERPDIDVNAQNNIGKTPLQHALSMLHASQGEKDVEIVRQLLAHPAVRVTLQDKDGNNALHYAAFYGLDEFVDEILARETVVTVTAKGKEESDTITTTPNERVDPNQLNNKGQTALLLATKANREKAALKLLSIKNTPVIYHDDDKSLLTYAVLSGNRNLVTAISEQQPGTVMVRHADADGNTALHIAVLCQRPDFVTLVLKANQDFPDLPCNPDLKNKGGDTPLMLAAEHGDVAMVKALIAAGANVMHENWIHEKPSEIALAAGNSAVAKVLIEQEMKLTYGKVSDLSMFKSVIAHPVDQPAMVISPKPQ